MSALPPKADIAERDIATDNRGYGPGARRG